MKNLIKNKYPILLIIFVILSILVYFQFYRPINKPENKESIADAKAEKLIYRKFDGVLVQNDELANEAVVGVMVENNIEAWPLAGLDKASVVYELLAEGRIPRFLALFSYNDIPQKIGPVRSARTYYLELNKPFLSPYLHVGGSPDALEKIKTYNIIDVNQFYWDQYFWRSNDRDAPHNVYTSKDLIREMFTEREFKTVNNINTWKYSDNKVDKDLGYVKDVVVNYTNNTYQAKYVYDYKDNKYQRFQAKEPLKLQDGSLVFVDNVIVEEHKHEIYDAIGRRNINLIGEGKVWVFNNGKVTQGLWKKDVVDVLTRYYDENNNEIILNRGKTWINIVDVGDFEYTNL